MKYIFSCQNTDTECVGRQSCYAQDVGMPEYCHGTFKETTGLQSLIIWAIRLGTLSVDWWKLKSRRFQ